MKFVHFFKDTRQNLAASIYLFVKKVLQAEKVDFECLYYDCKTYSGEFLIPLKTSDGKHFTGKVIITVEGEDEEEDEE